MNIKINCTITENINPGCPVNIPYATVVPCNNINDININTRLKRLLVPSDIKAIVI
jgi:hypothetical protein